MPWWLPPLPQPPSTAAHAAPPSGRRGKCTRLGVRAAEPSTPCACAPPRGRRASYQRRGPAAGSSGTSPRGARAPRRARGSARARARRCPRCGGRGPGSRPARCCVWFWGGGAQSRIVQVRKETAPMSGRVGQMQGGRSVHRFLQRAQRSKGAVHGSRGRGLHPPVVVGVLRIVVPPRDRRARPGGAARREHLLRRRLARARVGHGVCPGVPGARQPGAAPMHQRVRGGLAARALEGRGVAPAPAATAGGQSPG